MYRSLACKLLQGLQGTAISVAVAVVGLKLKSEVSTPASLVEMGSKKLLRIRSRQHMLWWVKKRLANIRFAVSWDSGTPGKLLLV